MSVEIAYQDTASQDTNTTDADTTITVNGSDVTSNAVADRSIVDWGIDLWDKYDEIIKHEEQGIDCIRKYHSFIKDRVELENSFAKQLKVLVKKHTPKYKNTELYTFQKAFSITVHEMGDEANQHERIAESLTANVLKPLQMLQGDKEAEKRTIVNDGNVQRAKFDGNVQQIERMKRRYEDSHREAISSQVALDRLEFNSKVTRDQVDKSKLILQQKERALAENKENYVLFIDKFNKIQQEHYYRQMPLIFDRFVKMEDTRISRVKFLQEQIVEGLRHVFPIINTCYDNVMAASKDTSVDKDLKQVIDEKKSGFPIPLDRFFVEYGSQHKQIQLTAGDTNKKHPKSKISSFFKKEKKVDDAEDYSHMPPAQQKKQIKDKIDSLLVTVNQSESSINAIKHMLDIYEKNPSMGNTKQTQEKLVEEKKGLDSLKIELYKFQVWYAQLENTDLPEKPELYTPTPIDVRQVTTLEERIKDRLLNEHQRQQRKDHEKARPIRPAQPKAPNQQLSPGDEFSDSSDEGDQYDQPSNVQSLPVLKQQSLPLDVSNTGGNNARLISAATYEEPQNTYFQPDEFQSSNDDVLGRVRALYPFAASSEGEITMEEGTVCNLLENDGSGWIYVEIGNNKGFVPLSYVETI